MNRPLSPFAAPISATSSTGLSPPSSPAHSNHAPAPPGTAQLRIVKKLSPGQPGAQKLTQRFGHHLVCVRHRLDPSGDTRITTVELVVARAPIQHRDNALVLVRIHYEEAHLRDLARQHGATWLPKLKRWHMPRQTAHRLGLRDRIES